MDIVQYNNTPRNKATTADDDDDGSSSFQNGTADDDGSLSLQVGESSSTDYTGLLYGERGVFDRCVCIYLISTSRFIVKLICIMFHALCLCVHKGCHYYSYLLLAAV